MFVALVLKKHSGVHFVIFPCFDLAVSFFWDTNQAAAKGEKLLSQK